MPSQVQFEDAERPGVVIVVEADPQTVVGPGVGDTAIIWFPDGERRTVIGNYRDVKVKIQAAAAQGHESGASPQPNTAMS